MFRRSEIPPDRVHDTLRQHMLVDGYPIVVDLERSNESRVRDQISGKEYLDFFSFFASNPIGLNHASMRDPDTLERLARGAPSKGVNSE